MSLCRACARRAIAAISESRSIIPRTQPTVVRPQTRLATTSAIAIQPKKDDRDGLQQPTTTQSSQRLEWIVRQHLRYLKEPFKIAAHVANTLAKDRYDEALLLTRTASRHADLTVSWNHLIEYQLQNQKLHAAIKLYNEMKKRQQTPNAQTFTIIFKGCANSEHPKLAVAEAIRLYHGMIGSTALRPNVIHMNAVLQVCARAGDLDSLFSILRTADDKLRSPNNLTYTAVLNALRYDVGRARDLPRQPGDPPFGQAEAKIAISRAKAVWKDVISSWRQGHVMIDEELVCAMGRLLVLGSKEDNDHILSLVEQTMSIPRFEALETPRPEIKGLVEADSSGSNGGDDLVTEESILNDATVDAFLAADLPRSSSHVQPGRNTLSLILTALCRLRRTHLALKYWHVLTTKYQIEPDSDNWFCLLKALRVGHASGKTAEMIMKMPPQFMRPKSFQYAMSSCIKDILNDHTFANAGKILDVMCRNLTVPDAHSMRLYLKTVLLNTRRFQIQADTGDPAGAKYAHGQQIMRGIDRLWEPFRLARNALSYPTAKSRSAEGEWGQQSAKHSELALLAQEMVGAIDTVVGNQMGTADEIKVMNVRRVHLTMYITRFYKKKNSATEAFGKTSRHTERKLGERGRRELNEAAADP